MEKEPNYADSSCGIRIKYAVAASGGGTVFQALIDGHTAGSIPNGEIVALISNKKDAGALERARTAGIPAHFIDHTATQEEIDEAIIKVLKNSGAQFVFLAGYLRKITPTILAYCPVYNIHPALDLQRFGGLGMYGLRVHQAVIDAKEPFTGATIHEVIEQYDQGTIIRQSKEVAVLKNDTAESLQKRVLEKEYRLAVKVIDQLTTKMMKGEPKQMKIVIVGGGGREHALANKFHQDDPTAQITAIPGNAGILAIPNAICVPLAATDVKAITEYCEQAQPDLVMVASDDPLALGLVDMLTEKGIRAFGPTKKAAEIEWSKSFSKDFMKRHNIPTASFKVFTNCDDALDYVKQVAAHPLVIKANGLALGKGVVISRNLTESENAIRSMMLDKKFGTSGDTIIIEEFLTGPEITLLAFVDGKNYALMPTSQDHKRAFDGDLGPNTGGMGAFSPAAAWTEDIEETVIKTIVEPTIKGMANEGRQFKGILYFGLMATPRGVKVIEYNARFGDPECQTILPLLETKLLDILNACIDGALDFIEVKWKNQVALCVVIASAEYPGDVKKGHPITIEDLVPSVTLIHCGTKQTPEGIVTNGGRVFCLTTTTYTMKQARDMIYKQITKIKFNGARYRKDIGKK